MNNFTIQKWQESLHVVKKSTTTCMLLKNIIYIIILSPANREMLSLGTVIRGCSNMYFHGCYYVSNLVKLSVQRQQIVGQVNRPLEFCSLSTRAQRLCLSSSNTSMNTPNKSNDITMKV